MSSTDDLPRQQVSPFELVPLLRAAFPEGSPEAVRIIEQATRLIDAGESLVIDLDVGEVRSLGHTVPPRVEVLKR